MVGLIYVGFALPKLEIVGIKKLVQNYNKKGVINLAPFFLKKFNIIKKAPHLVGSVKYIKYDLYYLGLGLP
jgi:hypothetical protein